MSGFNVPGKQRKGFTLIELLVVVAIIALLISILLPSLARARELAKRSVCASNLGMMGKGLYAYATSNSDTMPTAGPFNTGTTAGLTSVDYVIATAAEQLAQMNLDPSLGTNTTLSVTRNIYTLIREGDFSPGSVICPSSDGEKMDVEAAAIAAGKPIDGLFDFEKISQITYAYQMPYGRMGQPRTDFFGSENPIAADRGPFGNWLQAGGIQPPTTFPGYNEPPDMWMPFNSPNHGGETTGEGQNVLYGDAHASWANKPTAGESDDNIYTRWGVNPATATPTKDHRAQGTPPAASTYVAPYGDTDSLLFP